MRALFPFTAIVGQEQMLRALVLCAVDPRIGGVLIRGERGTAKSTAARALAALLPRQRVVHGCRFRCDPDQPITWCTECRLRFSGEEQPEVDVQPTPFVNLPVSATEDRVVGTLDIERAIQKGERAFEPGVLAAANRGLLYIDEVNLLDDHVVDVLLDSAAMGVNVVEREGISFSHPARFILVGTMNPEEGDLRPQLLDRFALSVEIRGIRAPTKRVEIMRRILAYETDPNAYYRHWLPLEKQLSERIEAARKRVNAVTHNRRDLLTIANLSTAFEVDGHRPDMVILKAARANAAFENRSAVRREDILTAAGLTLSHRLRHKPLDPSRMETEDLYQRLRQFVFPEKVYMPEESLYAGINREELLASMTDTEDDPWKGFDSGF